MDDGTRSEYAKGLRIWNYRGLRAVSHSGGSGGYHAYLMRFPAQHFSVACLCNHGARAAKRAYRVADAYLGELMKPEEKASEVGVAPEQLLAWAGTYRDVKNGDVWRIGVANEKLRVDFGAGPLELRALSPTEFEPVDYPFETHLTFERAQEGGPRKLHARIELWLESLGTPETFEAVEEVKPAAAELAGYAGDYSSDELRAIYRLAIKDGRLRMKELIGADEIVHVGNAPVNVPFNELRPVVTDEFDLRGAPMTIQFTRDKSKNLTGFKLSGFHERWILFTRLSDKK